jgi:nitrite reductase/ring-hydroxylating ferredoxin subunit
MRKALILLVACISFVSCGKVEGVVPNVPVSFTIAKTDPRIAALNSQGGAVLVTGVGVAGVIIYRRSDGAYVAYDRCSTYQPEKKCAVILDDNPFTVTDPCSGAKFLLSDGSPAKAPATKSLRVYTVNETPFQINVYN